MVSESLVPSVGNILFDGVAHCDFSAELGRLLLTATAFYTKIMLFCTFRRAGCPPFFNGSSVFYIIYER